jgi:hypothetical protein
VNLEALALGLVGIGAGSLLAVFGVRLFWILLALWGAVIGFLAGADIAAAVLGEGFLATTIGWVAGIAGAIALGLLAGAVYWGAIILLCGGVGYAIGSGIVLALGIEAGLLSVGAGLAAAAALVALAIVLRVPVVLVAILTSFGGTGYAIVGGLLLIGRVAVADLEGGALGALRDRPLAIIAWLALGATALAYQLLVAREDEQRLLGPLDQARTGGAA